MPIVIGHHDVKDKDHWLASPKREEVFGPLGVTNIRTFVNPQNPTQVAVLMDVADMDAVMAFMQTEAAAEAMAYDGVLTETLVLLVEALFPFSGAERIDSPMLRSPETRGGGGPSKMSYTGSSRERRSLAGRAPKYLVGGHIPQVCSLTTR
jgi:hypothetical protein